MYAKRMCDFFYELLHISKKSSTFAADMKRLYSLFLLLAFAIFAFGQEMTVAERNAAQGFNDTIDRLDPDFVTVSLCIADPTDQSQDYLGMTGHSFLRLQCPTFGLDYCFSYESEKIKGQLWDYLTGKLRMGMFAVSTNEYLEDYRVWKRAVHEYIINMPADAELRLWEQMDNHMMSENDMQMDLVKYDCANTLLRYVERALTPTQIIYEWPEKFMTKSAMELAEEQLANYPWSLLVVRLTAGKEYAKLTTPKQKILYPADLLEAWSNATINGEPMLTYTGDIVEAEPVVVKKPWFTPQVCGMLLLILTIGGIILAVIRRRKS